MQENDKPVLVYSTFPNAEAAENAARTLVERRLAACVNLIPGMVSVYRWESAVRSETEVVMIAKTRSGRADACMAAIRAVHPYETPALIVVPLSGGSPDYLGWILTETDASKS